MKDFAILSNLSIICDIVLTFTEEKSQSLFNLCLGETTETLK